MIQNLITNEKESLSMKKKILTTLFAAAFIFGILLPGTTPKNPEGTVSTYAVVDPVCNTF